MKHIPEIYISYAWEKQNDGTNWPIILTNLNKILIEEGYKVNIDTNNLKYKDNIKSFMQELGKGKNIISIISEKYMKSKNCMYEVLQMLKYPNYSDRIFPILTSDAKIYETEKIIEYLKFWDEKISNLNKEAKSLSNIAYAGPIFEDIEMMSEIHRALAKFGNEIGNMNVLTPEIHNDSNFSQLIECIERKKIIDENTISLKIENENLLKENSELKLELEDIKQKYALAILSKSEIKNIDETKIEKPKPVSLATQSISIFEEFLSLNRDSLLQDIHDKIGIPDQEDTDDKYSFNTLYYTEGDFDEAIIEISYYKKSHKIMHIAVESSIADLNANFLNFKKYTNDNKVQFLGKHKDDIFKVFGKPETENSDNYSYNLDNLNVTFICYDFNNYLCTRIEMIFLKNSPDYELKTIKSK